MLFYLLMIVVAADTNYSLFSYNKVKTMWVRKFATRLTVPNYSA